MLLRFVGLNEDYKLKHGLVYDCRIYSKNEYVWVKVKLNSLIFSNRFVHIPYATIERMYSEWRAYGEYYDDKMLV